MPSVKAKVKTPLSSSPSLPPARYVEAKGKVEVIEPAIKCAFCKGTGVYPRNGRVTCTVCNGKGTVTVKGETEGCPKCKGSGQEIESGLPCIKCGGKGVISKK